MSDLKKQILSQGLSVMQYHQMIANATSVNSPIGTVTLKDGTEAQVQLRVVTDKEEFIESVEYEISF